LRFAPATMPIAADTVRSFRGALSSLTGSISRLAKLAAGLPPSISPRWWTTQSSRAVRRHQNGRTSSRTVQRKSAADNGALANEPPRDHAEAYFLACTEQIRSLSVVSAMDSA
jgi:hypothetical protein